MNRLGFSPKWIDLTMIYIITTLFLILINGVVKGIIHSQRRLRQDCPLSLYFFILCVERFSNLLQQAETQKLIQGLKFNNNLTITYLLLAYDSLIFTRATTKDCTNLKLIFLTNTQLPRAKTSITKNPQCSLMETLKQGILRK